jgi:predicted permease
MTLATLFYFFGVMYFILTIVTIIFLIWWVSVHYFRLKEYLEKTKTKLTVVSNLKNIRKSPIIAGLLIPLIAFLLKRIGEDRKKRT